MKTSFLILMVCVGVLNLSAQYSLPKNNKLFDDDHLHCIDLNMDSAQLNEIIQHPDSNLIYPAQFIIRHAVEIDTVNEVGIRIKGATSRFNPKKSFKLSFDEYEKGKKYAGVEKLSLNTFWNDPTHIRAHLATKVYYFMGIPASRTSFADLYINGVYFGLYNIVEHIDEEFTKERFGSKKGNLYKCLGLADLTYQGENQDTYTGPESRYSYNLKSNKKENDFSGLIEFMDILNNTPIDELPCKLEMRFNVEDYLKIMAVDVATANWDDYIFAANNYYLYDNPKTGKFEYIPFDFDNTFGIDWTGNDWGKAKIYDWTKRNPFILNPDSLTGINDEEREWVWDFYDPFMQDTLRPLYTKLLKVDTYRNQFTSHLENIIKNYLATYAPLNEIDRVFAMLSPSLERDTSDKYTWEEVQASINEPIEVYEYFWSYKHTYLPYGLKEFIEVSNENILSQLEEIKPWTTLNHARAKNKKDQTLLGITVEGDQPVKLTAFVSRKHAPFFELNMADDGEMGDKEKGDRIYTVSMDKKDLAKIRYYFVAELADGELLREPCSGFFGE